MNNDTRKVASDIAIGNAFIRRVKDDIAAGYNKIATLHYETLAARIDPRKLECRTPPGYDYEHLARCVIDSSTPNYTAMIRDLSLFIHETNPAEGAYEVRVLSYPIPSNDSDIYGNGWLTIASRPVSPDRFIPAELNGIPPIQTVTFSAAFIGDTCIKHPCDLSYFTDITQDVLSVVSKLNPNDLGEVETGEEYTFNYCGYLAHIIRDACDTPQVSIYVSEKI